MNETEKDRILRMVSEGTLRPAEAAHLLAALAEEPAPAEKAADSKAKEKEKEKPKEPMMDVQFQRPDGTSYTIQVPPHLFSMVWAVAKAQMKEAAKNAARDTWSGMKTIVRRKTTEVKNSVTSRLPGHKKAEEKAANAPDPLVESQFEARRRILQMVQNGRISADEATRLIQQLDALNEYEKKTTVASNP